MIEIKPKIHDRNTLEFKVGFIARDDRPYSEFQMNTWIYIPESLDVNRFTYAKDSFYRDTRSMLRLITPSYSLGELSADGQALPYVRLRRACEAVARGEKGDARRVYEGEVKMFASIVKSSIRDGYERIVGAESREKASRLCADYAAAIAVVLRRYRDVGHMFGENGCSDTVSGPFRFGDEFMSNVVEQHLFRLADHFSRLGMEAGIGCIDSLLRQEDEYRRLKGFLRVEAGGHNRQFVYRAGQLKKYIESNLYLPAHKRSNTVLLEQVAFSVAAGVAMVFATVVSFAFQQTYGNFTLPFFIALVISYMFKDRIKDLIRYYFANRIGSRFYDHVINVRVGGSNVGWSKEGFDFVAAGKVSRRVREARAMKSPLLIGRGADEHVMQYRKKVRLSRKAVSRLSQYPLIGVNEIMRYNFAELMRRMDNPKVPLYANQGGASICRADGDKVYYVNIVILCACDGQRQYKRYKVCLSQAGINDIAEP